MEKIKDMWRGAFNLNHEVFIEYTYAYTKRQAWLVFCRRIAKKTGVHPSVTMSYFDGSKDNFSIQKEVEFEKDHQDQSDVAP